MVFPEELESVGRARRPSYHSKVDCGCYYWTWILLDDYLLITETIDAFREKLCR